MNQHNTFFDEFRQLNLSVQIILILCTVLLLILLIVNPAAGVAVTGFLIALKGLFLPGGDSHPKS